MITSKNEQEERLSAMGMIQVMVQLTRLTGALSEERHQCQHLEPSAVNVYQLQGSLTVSQTISARRSIT